MTELHYALIGAAAVLLLLLLALSKLQERRQVRRLRESHVHDVTITKEAPNYRLD